MRHKSDFSVVFDGVTILAVGDYIEGDMLPAVSFAHGIEAAATVANESALVRDLGSSQGTFSIASSRDFENPSEALSFISAQVAAWHKGRTGALSFGMVDFPSAGLDSFSINGVYVSGKARVTSTYSFITSYHA